LCAQFLPSEPPAHTAGRLAGDSRSTRRYRTHETRSLYHHLPARVNAPCALTLQQHSGLGAKLVDQLRALGAEDGLARSRSAATREELSYTLLAREVDHRLELEGTDMESAGREPRPRRSPRLCLRAPAVAGRSSGRTCRRSARCGGKPGSGYSRISVPADQILPLIRTRAACPSIRYDPGRPQ